MRNVRTVLGNTKTQTEFPVEPMFLTAREVGQHLGLHKSRVYELAASGMLPVVRLGRRMLFPRRGLEAMVDVAIERVRTHLVEPSGTEKDRLVQTTVPGSR